jgi:DNA polymerase-1
LLPEFDVVIIDGLNQAFRHHYSRANLKDKKGRPTSMYYGFINRIFQVKKKYKGVKVETCWDSPQLKKKQLNKSYKSDRNNKKNEIYSMAELLKEYLSIYGIDQFYALGYEADDIILRRAKKYSEDGKKVLIISNDSDMLLGMDKNIYILRNNDKIFNHKNILKHVGEKDGIEFHSKEQFHLYLSITGTHNNVSGIYGFRKKKAIEIISKNNEIEQLLKDNQRKLKKIDKKDKLFKARNEIIENSDLLKSNYKLITPIIKGYRIEKIKKNKDMKKLIEILEDYNMTSLVSKLTGKKIKTMRDIDEL